MSLNGCRICGRILDLDDLDGVCAICDADPPEEKPIIKPCPECGTSMDDIYKALKYDRVAEDLVDVQSERDCLLGITIAQQEKIGSLTGS